MNEDSLSKQAIKHALSGNWKNAIEINKQVLKRKANDIDALCRLAKAYSQLGKFNLASRYYRKVLKNDKFNLIAQKNLSKLNCQKSSDKIKISKNLIIDPSLFLEEAGKTKVVSLVRLGLPKIILNLNIGAPVQLIPKKRAIYIYDENCHYLGKLADDLSSRLIKLINRGNQYQAVTKSMDAKTLTIFIKEIKRSKKNNSFVSFPLQKEHYHAFMPTGILTPEPTIETSENQYLS